MYLRLLDIEARKLIRQPLAWLGLAALVGILAMYFVARYGLLARSGGEDLMRARSWEFDLETGLVLFRFVGIIFLAAASALVGAYDLDEHGIQLWLTRGVPRSLLMLARMLVVLLVGLGIVAIAMSGSLAVGSLARIVFVGDAGVQNPDWRLLIETVLRVAWGAAPYMALTTFLAIATRSALYGAGGAIVFRTVVENILPGLADRFPTLVRLLPAQLALAMEADLHGSAVTATPLLGLPQAAASIGILLLVFCSLTLIVFSRQDWGGH